VFGKIMNFLALLPLKKRAQCRGENKRKYGKNPRDLSGNISVLKVWSQFWAKKDIL
jgi:hypothetical protein